MELRRWSEENRHRPYHHIPMPFGNIKPTIFKIVDALSAVFSHLPSDKDGEHVGKPQQKFLSDLAEYNIPTKRLEAAILSRVPEVREQTLKQVAAAMLDNNYDVVVDALTAAGVLAHALSEHALSEEETHAQFSVVAVMLVQGVQWRHRPALAYRLRIVADLVKRQPWFLSMEMLSGILVGLGEIAVETSSTGVRGNDQDGVIAIRAAAAALAFALFEHCPDSVADGHEVIRCWRELCRNPDEFSEVKNSWMVAGGCKDAVELA